MLKYLRHNAAAVGLLLAWCCCVATAQQSQPPAPRVEESQPSIFYLPDKQGNLQPVLDFQYQDFVDLYKLKNQLGGAISRRDTVCNGCRPRERQDRLLPS